MIAVLILLSFTTIFGFTGLTQAPKSKVVMVGEDGIRRSASKTVMPDYPEASKKRRSKGVAVVGVQYDGDGTVELVNVLEAPDEEIKNAVSEAVKQWRFRKSTYRGEPLSVRGKLTFYFSIDQAGRGKVSNPRQYK